MSPGYSVRQSQSQSQKKKKKKSQPKSNSILDAALRKYNEMTGSDLLDHRLVKELQIYNSVDTILAKIQHQAKAFGDSDKEVMKWIDPSVHGLYTISSSYDAARVYASWKLVAVFAGIGALFSVAKDVRESHGHALMATRNKKGIEKKGHESHDTLVPLLVDLFQRLQFILKRLGVYTLRSPEDEKLGEKIVARVISILSIVTKEIQQSRGEELGTKNIEDDLVELGNLTREVVRIAIFRVWDSITYGKADESVQQIANVSQTKWNQIEWDVRKWLSSPDPSINYDIACATQHEGTSTWFFESSIFKEWGLNGSLLWIHGKPGSGKTILCSAIIKHVSSLRDAGHASLGYFYFDFRDGEKQNIRNFVSSLLTQLAASSEPCCDLIFRLYSTHGKGLRQPTIHVLIGYLHEMLFIAAQQPIYIIVDALDECPNMPGTPTPRRAVLNLLADLIDMHDTSLHICITSCPEIDVRTVLEPLAYGAVSLHNENGQQKDIFDYVRNVVYSDKTTRRWRNSDRKLVVEELSKKADGRFRWVFCQLEALQHCDPPNILQTLRRQSSKTLDETYARILSRISPANRTLVYRILQCLMVATRPLRIEELAEVLAFKFDTSQGAVPRYRPRLRSNNQERVALSTCPTLVAIFDDHGSQFVQFCHSSVQEFLKSDLFISSLGNLSRYWVLPGAARTILAQACLGFIFYLDDRIDDENVKDLPLVKYAAEHWLIHAQAEDVASRLKDVMKDLFGPDFATWVGMYDYNIDEPYQADRGSFSKIPTSLSSAPDFVERLAIKHPQHINTVDRQSDFPLLAALRRKQFLVAEILLTSVVRANIRGIRGRTPLHNIIRESDADAIQLLLKYGADVNARQDDHSTPLHLTARNGNLTGARLLLTHGAKVNARNLEGMTPLCLLTEHNHIGLTHLLLQHGADVNSRTKKQWTPLHWSALRGRLEITRALLDRGANANAENDQGETPLHLVSKGHHDSQEDGCSIAKLLLERGADPHARNKDYTTPWLLARFRGRFDIARVLLYHDAKTPDGE